MKSLLQYLLCGLLFLTAGGLNFSYAQLVLEIKTFSANDGIQSFSRTLTDSQGITWFTYVSSIEDGINKFDGRQFETFHCGNFATLNNYGFWRYFPFLKDQEGYVWAGTTKGIYKMHNGKPVLMFSKLNGLTSDSIVAMTFDLQNNLWIMTPEKLVVAKNNSGKYELNSIGKKYSINLKSKKRISDKFDKGFLDCDSLGNLWWGKFSYEDTTVSLFFTKNYFDSSTKISTSFFHMGMYSPTTINGGLLMFNESEELFFLDSLGTIYYLDKNLKRFIGSDNSGNHYFYSKPENNLSMVYRYNPSIFTNPDQPHSAFVFSKKINLTGGINGYAVNDEFWLINSFADGPGYLIKGNNLFSLDSIYPAASLRKIQIFETEKGVFWAHKWQNQLSSLIKVPNNLTIINLPQNPNGSSIESYNAYDSTFCLIVSTFEDYYLFAYQNGKFSQVTNKPFTHFKERQGNKWFYSEKEKTISHFKNKQTEDIYKSTILSDLILDSSGRGCFILADSQKISFLHDKKIENYFLPIKEKSKKIFTGPDGKIYVQTLDDRILIWNPFKEINPLEIKGLPNGKIYEIYETGEIVCFQKGGQTGWLDKGELNILDTILYPFHGAGYRGVMQDINKRIFFGGNKDQKNLKEMLVYENRNYSKFPLANSVLSKNFYIAECVNGSNEIIYFDGPKIYRYNKQLKRFYFIKNIGENCGYIWTAKIIKNKLYITGWSSKLFIIDLDKCPVTFPKLSFRSITNNGSELDENLISTINYGDNLVANFIGIEKFNQSKIRYQTRTIGIDSLWGEANRNETKEFLNINPGKYRFEIRTKGESEIWSQPIGFNFIVLPPWYKTHPAYLTYLFLFLTFTYFLVKFNTRRLKLINEHLSSKIRNATIEIRKQKEFVEEKNREITDSIKYALKIQTAILPPKKIIKQYLNNSFLLYKPKDIVAGDFYWMEIIDDIIFIAAADCTGHGVPGAMVSVVCSNALNRTVKEFALRDTGKILDKVTDLVLETFEKSGEQIKDGMDISFLSYNKTSKQIQWSGANNPLWYISNGQIIEVKADKQPIGKFDIRKPFTTHAIEYSENTTFYLFTDGLPDQFGGPKGKKFMYKRFETNLADICKLPMDEQQGILEKAFQDWKGTLEQVDDVTVIGIRI